MVDILRVLNQPGWDYRLTHEGVSIKAPTRKDASLFARRYADALTETAFKFRGCVRVGWRKCKQPLEFHGWMVNTATPTPHETAEAILNHDGKVFSALKDLPVLLLKRMVSAGESEFPWSIVRNTDQKIVVLNTPMSTLIATPKELATQRICRDYWRPDDWDNLQQRYRLYGHFTWRYDAGLNHHTWADLETDFERFEVDGAIYGQNIIYRAEIVPMPDHVLLPV